MIPAAVLAYADTAEPSGDMLVLVMESLGVLTLVTLVAAVPLLVTTARRAVRPNVLAPLCFLWAFLVGGGWIYLLLARYRWDVEYHKLLMSGYYDPLNTGTRPGVHPAFLLAGALGYGVLIVTALRSQGRDPGARAEGNSADGADRSGANGRPQE